MGRLIYGFILILFVSCGARKVDSSKSVTKTDEKKTEFSESEEKKDISYDVTKSEEKEVFEWDLEVTPVDPNKEVVITKPNGEVVKFLNANVKSSVKNTKSASKETEKYVDKSTIKLVKYTIETKYTIVTTKEKKTDRESNFPFYLIVVGVLVAGITLYRYFYKSNPLT